MLAALGGGVGGGPLFGDCEGGVERWHAANMPVTNVQSTIAAFFRIVVAAAKLHICRQCGRYGERCRVAEQLTDVCG